MCLLMSLVRCKTSIKGLKDHLYLELLGNTLSELSKSVKC